MKEELSEELKADAEDFVSTKIAPFMEDFLASYKIWCDKYGAEAATETSSRLFAYMIHGPLAGLQEENAAGLINDISQKAFSMFLVVRDKKISNDNEVRH